jgi:hypothetical protein
MEEYIMKRFKAVVIHCLANVVEVVANSKEEAEAKIRDIDNSTDVISQLENTKLFPVYKVFEADSESEDCDTDDAQTVSDDEEV